MVLMAVWGGYYSNILNCRGFCVFGHVCQGAMISLLYLDLGVKYTRTSISRI